MKKKILILGKMESKTAFNEVVQAISDGGDIPINPIAVMYALPAEINQSDFIAVLIELVRISDAVMLVPGWDSDLASTIAKTNAERSEKELIKWYRWPAK